MYFEVAVFISLVHFWWQSQNKVGRIVILVLWRVYENLVDNWPFATHWEISASYKYINLMKLYPILPNFINTIP